MLGSRMRYLNRWESLNLGQVSIIKVSCLPFGYLVSGEVRYYPIPGSVTPQTM